MGADRSAGRLLECGLSRRDILIGSLLAMDGVLPSLGDKDVQVIARLVEELSVAVIDCATPLSVLAYGIPHWLIGSVKDNSQSSGLGAFIWSVYCGQGTWSTLFKEISKNLDDLERLYKALAESPFPAPREQFRNLRTRAAVAADGSIQDRPLQAGGVSREQSELMAVAQIAAGAGDPLLSDLGSRIGRMDFVVVGERHGDVGLVLGATVALNSEPSPRNVRVQPPHPDSLHDIFGVDSWTPASQNFCEGLDRGRDAVLHLLRSINAKPELRDRVHGITVEIRGVLPKAFISDKSAGLPLALNILSQLTDLAMPPVLPTGVFNSDFTLEPMERSTVEAKARAVEEDGLNDALLVHSPRLPVSDHIRLIDSNTLRSACEALWGDRWKAWEEQIRSKALEEMGLAEGWHTGQLDGAFLIDNVPVEIETRQSKQITDNFLGSNSSLVCTLGGRAQSGKTWIAHQVQRTLQARGWAVAVLRPVDGGFPSTESLERYLVSRQDRRNLRQRALLILDEMETDDTEDEFIFELQRLRNKFNTNILAVVRLDTGIELDFENVTSYRAIVDDKDLEEFASRIINQCESFRMAESCIGTAIKGSGGNLWLLIRLLNTAAETPEASYQELLDQYYRAILGNYSHVQMRLAEQLASLSRVDIPAPEWFLAPLDADFLRSLSASRSTAGYWRFPVPAACEAIIGYSQNAIAGNRLSLIRKRIINNLNAYCRRCVREGQHEDLINALTKLRRGNADILSSTFAELRKDLVAWTHVMTNPVEISKVFGAIQEDVNEEERSEIARHMLTLFCDELPALTIRQLAKMLNLLRSHRMVLRKDEEQHTRWQQMLESLKETIPLMLVGQASRPRARLTLVRSLWRLHEDVVDQLIIDNMDVLLKEEGKHPGAEEYLLALELLAIADRIQGHRQTNKFFETSTNLAGLANKPPDRAAGFLAHVCYLVLHLRAAGEVWDETVHEERTALLSELGRTGTWEVAETLKALIRYDRKFGVKLINTLQPTEPLRRILQAAEPGEGAGMLRLLAQLHLFSAWTILYDKNHRPLRDLATKVAQRIHNGGDPRGAGMMLKTCAYVDSSFGVIHDGFAKALSESIGMAFFENQFQGDRRTSVLFHLLQGLMEAQASFSPSIQDSAVNAVARAINSGNLRDWAPRLALLALENPDLREKFAADLREKVPAATLLRGMSSARTLEALASFHQLSAALYPDLPSKFSPKDCGRAFEALYRGDRPEVVTRAARAISLTLRRSGDEHPGQTMIERLNRNWKSELEGSATAGDCAETIRNLIVLNGTIAQDAVRGATRRLKRIVERGLDQEFLLGIELLDAIEQAAPGLGSALVKDFEENDPHYWDAMVEDIAFEQDPRSQGTAFHRLAQLGGFPSKERQRKVMEIWETRFSLITSPAAIVPLLRTFAAWDPKSIYEWSGKMNTDRIVFRLSGHATADLEWVGALLSALNYAGKIDARDKIIVIVDEVANLPERIGLYNTSRLIWLLHPINRSVGRRLLEKARISLEKRIDDPLVPDEEEFLWTVGWLGRICRLYGEPLTIIKQPRWWQQFPLPPIASLWATCWLDDCDWTKELMHRSLEQLGAVSLPLRPGAMCAALIAATEHDRLDAVQSISAQWPAALNASLYLLEELIEMGLKSPILNAFLRQNEEKLRQRIGAPSHRLHPARARAEDMLRKTTSPEYSSMRAQT